jgi:hypothetical protein
MSDGPQAEKPGMVALRRMWGEDRKPALILLTSTICTCLWWMLAHQHDATLAALGKRTDFGAYLAAAWPMFGSSLVILGLVPMLVIVVGLRERLTDFGLGLGDWKFGLRATLIASPLLILIAYLASLSALPDGYMPQLSKPWFAVHILTQLLFYIGFEFHFRGFVQLGLGGQGVAAIPIWTSIMGATLAHLGRSPGEVFASIGGSLFWSLVVVRTRSVWYGVLMHWLLGIALDCFLLFG